MLFFFYVCVVLPEQWDKEAPESHMEKLWEGAQ